MQNLLNKVLGKKFFPILEFDNLPKLDYIIFMIGSSFDIQTKKLGSPVVLPTLKN